MQPSLIVHIWIVCALGLFIDGYDLYISSIAEPFINATYHPSPLVLGLIQAAAPLGATLGALFMGALADCIGRKKMLLANLIFFIVIAILSACAWSSLSLCITRFLIGVGVGADYPIVAAYLAEMLKEKERGKMIAYAMLINCLASPFAAILGWLLAHYFSAATIWRYLFAAGALPASVGLFLRARLPESFLWQASQRLRKNKNMLQHFYFLFSQPYLKATLCLSLCWFLQDISYYGIALFTPFILRATHINNMLFNTLLVNVFVALGALAACFVIDKMHPLRLQKLGFYYAALGLTLLSISYLNSSIVFLGFILFNFFINFGPGITTYLLPTEYYPPHIKASGHGVATAFGKFGACLGALSLPYLQAHLGIYITVAIFAGTLVLGYLLTTLLETHEPSLTLISQTVS